jgi:hypothetical protein
VADGVVTGFHHLALTVRDLDLGTAWHAEAMRADVDAWVEG